LFIRTRDSQYIEKTIHKWNQLNTSVIIINLNIHVKNVKGQVFVIIINLNIHAKNVKGPVFVIMIN